MRFLVDAQLPLRLAHRLADHGHEVVHTTQLPLANRTPDGDVSAIADLEDRTVVTKDRDFQISHLLQGAPRSLLLITTGNISNTALLELIDRHLELLIAALVESSFVELSASALTIHRGTAE